MKSAVRFKHVVYLSVSENHRIQALLEKEAARLNEQIRVAKRDGYRDDYLIGRWTEDEKECIETATAIRKAFLDPILD